MYILKRGSKNFMYLLTRKISVVGILILLYIIIRFYQKLSYISVLQDDEIEKLYAEIYSMKHLVENLEDNNTFSVEPILDSIKSTPLTDELLAYHTSRTIMQAPKPYFVSAIKNPCFKLERNPDQLNCLPFYYIVGFTKAGTTEFASRLSMHQHIIPPVKKEAHFWDNLRNSQHNTIDNYLQYTSTVRAIIEEKCLAQPKVRECPYITGDSTPATIWYADRWEEEVTNANQTEPVHLTPHKIFHINPNAKIIILLRDPVERMFSDYCYYSVKAHRFAAYELKSEDVAKYARNEFHSRVVSALKWWIKCTEGLGLSERKCAYGIHYPPELPPLGIDVQLAQNEYSTPFTNYWKGPSADRLRNGIYHIFVRDWLEVFSSRNILILKLEDYIKNPTGTMTAKVLPFLNLPPFSTKVKYYLDLLDELGLRGSDLNASYLKTEMSNKTRVLLQDFYSSHNAALADLLQNASYNYTYQ